MIKVNQFLFCLKYILSLSQNEVGQVKAQVSLNWPVARSSGQMQV